MAGDVLDDHNGVVHDEPGRDGQRHQREVVEGVAKHVHDSERAEERERHAYRRDEGGAGLAQESKDNKDDQEDRYDERACHIPNGRSDGQRAVERHVELNGRRYRSLKRGKKRLDVVDGLDDVRGGRLEYDDEDGRLAVVAAESVDVFDGVDHVCDVLYAHYAWLRRTTGHRRVCRRVGAGRRCGNGGG